MKKRLFIALVMLMLIVAFAIPAQALQGAQYGSHPNNDTNYFVTDGEYYYFKAFGSCDEKDNYTPYRIMKQSITSGAQSVLYYADGENDIYDLNLLDGWIYFSSGWDGNVYRIGTDGKNLTHIYTARQPGNTSLIVNVYNILVADSKIYLTCSAQTAENYNQQQLVSVNLDGSNPTIIFKAAGIIHSLTIYDNQVFAGYGNSVFRYDIVGKTSSHFTLQGVSNDRNYQLQVSTAGRLYLYHSRADIGNDVDSLYSFNLDGSDLKRESTVYDWYIIVGNDIYYYASDENIYKTSLQNGGTPVKISSAPLGRTGKYFTYSNGYLFAYDFDNSGKQLNCFFKIGSADAPDTSTVISDVKKTDYFYDAVLWAIDNDMIDTQSKALKPNEVAPRSEIVEYLWKFSGSPEPTVANPFSDVSPTDSYYKAAIWAYEKGVTTGTTASTFSPKAFCTRGQTVTFIWRALGSINTDSTTNFTDVDGGAYYASAVAFAVDKGITKGTSTTAFSPDSTCTRAQILTFLYRGM